MSSPEMPGPEQGPASQEFSPLPSPEEVERMSPDEKTELLERWRQEGEPLTERIEEDLDQAWEDRVREYEGEPKQAKRILIISCASTGNPRSLLKVALADKRLNPTNLDLVNPIPKKTGLESDEQTEFDRKHAEYSKYYDSDKLPDSFDQVAGIIFTGSLATVDQTEQYPWINDLEDFMLRAADAKVPVLNICFGHQMYADARGIEVVKARGGFERGPRKAALYGPIKDPDDPDGEKKRFDDPILEGIKIQIGPDPEDPKQKVASAVFAVSAVHSQRIGYPRDREGRYDLTTQIGFNFSKNLMVSQFPETGATHAPAPYPYFDIDHRDGREVYGIQWHPEDSAPLGLRERGITLTKLAYKLHDQGQDPFEALERFKHFKADVEAAHQRGEVPDSLKIFHNFVDIALPGLKKGQK